MIHRGLDEEATAAALLAQVLQAATARHRSREALAGALADLYGASLGLGVGRLGDRQLLQGTLEWPTDHVPRARGLLERGLRLFGEVLSRPLRARRAGGTRGQAVALDGALVEIERRNLARTYQALQDDKPRYAYQRSVHHAFSGEPFARDPMGDAMALAGITASDLGLLHARMLALAPVDIYLMGDVGAREATAAVRKHLLWARGGAAPVDPGPVASMRAARSRPRRVAERADIRQTRLVQVWRGQIPVTERNTAAAATLAGVLGGGSFGRLFQVVREREGLCYSVDASWNAAKGALFVTTGIEADGEAKVRRLIRRIQSEVAGGVLDAKALAAFRETAAEQTLALADDRYAQLGWLQAAEALGADPSAERHLAALRRVRPADVRRVGARLGLDTTFVLLPASSGVSS